ncbi:MAG TPA: MBOAT family protein [Bryobacteraceae bacterium]|nr:MBOAT family protein [Bryobacteraceae bacterium]
MAFNTIEFFIFLPAVLALFYILPWPARKPLLLAASYFFYAWWNAKFLPLLWILTLIDYAAGRLLAQAERGRKLILVASLCANLGFLGFFKYYNFLASTWARILGRPPDSFFLEIILPLGISFHTFQSMSYVIDVYRRQQKPIRNLLDYALFIAFFPQLVAGPIVRAREFFGDLYDWKPPDAAAAQRSALSILAGLAKKMIFADQLAKVADPYFQNPGAYPGMLPAWSATFAFALQIFFDFSGYTDIAIGSAGLLGFQFPKNFARPYLASSVTEFWRRWHISLSRWLRDYLYIPLGGNRSGRWMIYRNLMITMLLGGLWHGASWNFLLWGGWHGLLLSAERATGRREGGRNPARVALTFVLVLVGWVLFRARTWPIAAAVYSEMFSGTTGRSLLHAGHWTLAAFSLVLAVAEERLAIFERFPRAPAWAQASTLAAVLLALELFGVTDQRIPFIYFQF